MTIESPTQAYYNQTLPEPPTKEQLIADILQTAIKAQYATERCIFAEFSGHVNQLQISIRKDRKNYSEIIAEKTIYLRLYNEDSATDEQKQAFEENLLQQLAETHAALIGFVLEGSIDTHNLKEVKTYTF